MDLARRKYTVFISHAGPDKFTIAFPLRDSLLSHNITAFVDEADIGTGKYAKKEMIEAMETAQIAVIVLSPEFVAREWPMKELMCFLRRCKEPHDQWGPPVILPFFYRLSVSDMYHEPRLDRVDENGSSLYLASRFLDRMSRGEVEASIPQIKNALQELHGIMGVRNNDGISNDNNFEMKKGRQKLVHTLSEKVRAILTENEETGNNGGGVMS